MPDGKVPDVSGAGLLPGSTPAYGYKLLSVVVARTRAVSRGTMKETSFVCDTPRLPSTSTNGRTLHHQRRVALEVLRRQQRRWRMIALAPDEYWKAAPVPQAGLGPFIQIVQARGSGQARYRTRCWTMLRGGRLGDKSSTPTLRVAMWLQYTATLRRCWTPTTLSTRMLFRRRRARQVPDRRHLSDGYAGQWLVRDETGHAPWSSPPTSSYPSTLPAQFLAGFQDRGAAARDARRRTWSALPRSGEVRWIVLPSEVAEDLPGGETASHPEGHWATAGRW